MITNAQYKKDMYSLLKIITTLYETDCRDINSEEVHQLYTRVNAIPDKDEIDEFQARTEEMRQNVKEVQHKQTGFDPNEARGRDTVTFMDAFGNASAAENDEPHDLGNVLHIPSEDDK